MIPENDTEFMASFDAVGLHYPCTEAALKGSGPTLIEDGKAIWASEDWWSEAEWGGAACWAKLFNQVSNPHLILTQPNPHLILTSSSPSPNPHPILT